MPGAPGGSGTHGAAGSDPLVGSRGAPPALQRARADPLTTAWAQASSFDRHAKVVRAETLTSTGTVLLTFQVIDGHSLAFVPGQFVTIVVTEPPESPDSLRDPDAPQSPYAICTAPTGTPTFGVLLRVVPDGPVATFLSSRRTGDVVAFRGPLGRSMVPPDRTRDLALWATGVGVGPFLGLVEHLGRHGFDRRIQLAWGLRHTDDVCLLDELDRLTRAYPLFSYDVSLSAPDATWTGRRGRITEWAPMLIDDIDRFRFYLCGNGAMVEEMAAALSEVGVTSDRVYGEPYFKRYHRPDSGTVHRIAERFLRHAPLLPGVEANDPFPLSAPVNRQPD